MTTVEEAREALLSALRDRWTHQGDPAGYDSEELANDFEATIRAKERARYEALVEAATEFAHKFHATYEMNQATGKLGNALAALREECPG